MSILRLNVSTARPTSELVSRFETAGGSRAILQRLINYLTSISSGSESAFSTTVPPSVNIEIQENKASATGTVTFSAVATSGDTILINGVTFTADAVQGANQWAVGASATASAANLVIAVNASVTALVTGMVTASSLAGVVTITASNPGTTGNTITIAEGVDGGGVISVSGARLTGGTADATTQTLTF